MTSTSIPHAIKYIMDGNFETLKQLDDEQIKKCDNLGRSALHAACYKGNVEILNYLLKERDFDKNQSDKDGKTVVHYCCGAEWK